MVLLRIGERLSVGVAVVSTLDVSSTVNSDDSTPLDRAENRDVKLAVTPSVVVGCENVNDGEKDSTTKEEMTEEGATVCTVED